MSTTHKSSSFCFCTLAFGSNYNRLAQLLAEDIARFASHAKLVVYTDRPHLFQQYNHVIAVEHTCRGVQSYHERRFAIWHALSLAETVIYLDADVRICAPFPMDFQVDVGLTARSCGSLQQHLQERFERPNLKPEEQHKLSVIQRMAEHADIALDSQTLKFINEFLFAIKVDGGREREFLRLWGELAIYADTLGMHKHPTYAMALAAAKSGFSVQYSEMPGVDFFDDRIEKIRIRNGQSDPEAKAHYFAAQQQIEVIPQSRLQKGINLIQRKARLTYHRLRVRLAAKFARASLVEYTTL